MKFDWYQASIPGINPIAIMETFSKSEYYGDWEQSKPLKGYDRASQFVIGGEVLYKINHGGHNEEFGANVVGSGSYAERLAAIVRENFPSHKVSRVDSCEDFHHPDVYAYLRKKALQIAKEQKVKVREIVKPLSECDDGRTLYLGSQTSAVSMRIYEKGKQLGCGTEWVRAELQVRPQKDLKQIVSRLSAVELWGMSKWSLNMAAQMGNKNIQRVDAQIYHQSDHDRAYRFMLKQYRKVLSQMLCTHGSPETVGAQIFHDLKEMAMPPVKAVIKPIK